MLRVGVELSPAGQASLGRHEVDGFLCSCVFGHGLCRLVRSSLYLETVRKTIVTTLRDQHVPFADSIV